MIDDEDKQIFDALDAIFDADGKGDKHTLANIALTVGVVVDTDDPLQNGRVRIFCPSLNDDPKKLLQLPWAAYVSPFMGVINNKNFARGSDPSNATSTGAIHYGFWGIPERGAHALVGCIDGDPRRRFFLGCFPSHQETHTLFNGRFKWGADGTPDGPLTSSNDEIQPLYDNLSEAFNDSRTSSEWKTRGADFQATAINDSPGEIPNPKKGSYVDNSSEDIINAEGDAWVKEVIGSHGYDWTAFKNLGPFMHSKVYGFTTPGFHTIMMDDRPFNNRVLLRSTSGKRILLDDTNERIYIATAKGNAWIEMDESGNVDVYAKRRLSVHAEKDINFSTEGSFRVKATKGIFMYAGVTEGSPLDSIPPDGQIRLHSQHDLHLYADANIRSHADQNMYIDADGDIHVRGVGFTQNASGNYGVISSGNLDLRASQRVSSTVGSSGVQVNSSSVVSSATGDVFFKGGSVQTSVSAINTTFTQKDNGSGSGVTSASVPALASPSIQASESDAEISIWTNRVPNHEPWPRVMKQDGDDPLNELNPGYKNNVGWVDQFDNTSTKGRQNVGKVEGDESIVRGKFWRR